jgi:lipopolysaccharide transport system permease protein
MSRQVLQVAMKIAPHYLMLCGAFLVSVQVRLKIPWGNRLGSEYQAQSWQVYALLLFATCIAYALTRILIRFTSKCTVAHNAEFFSYCTALLIAALLVAALQSDISGLQLVYFAGSGSLLGVAVHGSRHQADVLPNSPTLLLEYLIRLRKRNFLLGLWLRYNIEARYSQTVLGILWIILLPISTALVLSFAFSEVLGFALDVPYISFFLAALVPWNVFSQGVFNGMRAVQGASALINQVVFPREILIFVTFGEAFIDFLFAFAAMLIVNALHGILPNANYIYLPFVLLMLACLTTGLMFFVSYLSIRVRDIPQFVAVAIQLLFYLTPILYAVENIPPRFQVITLLNPMASLIQAYRDIIVFDRPPDLLTLYVPGVLSLTLLYTGYMYFKSNEDRFADLV